MADISQSQFCAILGKLRDQTAARSGALSAANYGLARLAGSIQLARGQIADAIQSSGVPRGLALPIDTNLYTQLIATCPGLLPPLPADATRALVAVSALQALINAQSPTDMLNTMVGNPLGRLKGVRDTLNGVIDQVKGAVAAPQASLGIPGSVGDVAKAAAKVLTNEAKIFATRAIADALDKAGIDPNAADRCAGRLCAVGTTFRPPG